MVQRDRLLGMLVEGDQAVVSLVAPGGYGKTTLLSQWAAAHKGPVVWLTVDALDNDPIVLMSCLGAAVDRVSPIGPQTAKALLSGGRHIFASAMPRLVSELHDWAEPSLIVVDDVHELTDRTALDALSTLIDHLPEHCRVAFAGRHQAQLPFARLAAHRHLLDLGPRELAMDTKETAALVDGAGYELSPDEISALPQPAARLPRRRA